MAGVWGCPPDTIFPPFLARKGKASPLLRGAPSGPHGGWSKGFFIILLEQIVVFGGGGVNIFLLDRQGHSR